MGLPYVLSSDLVSAYPAKSLEIAQYVDGLIPLLAMTQNAQTGTTYTFVLTDFTKLVTLSNASAVAVTLPLESSVAWPAGTQLRLLNLGAGTVTVAGAVGVTINGTPLTLAQYKGAILTKTGTNTWVFLPFSGGSAAAVVSSTTGSPTITTDGSATVYTFTGDGTIVIGTAGVATLLAVGAGGGAGQGTGDSGGGGGGGQVLSAAANLLAQTYTIKVPAGGAGGPAGNNPGSTGFAAAMRSVLQACGGGGGGLSSGAGREGVSWYTGGGAGGYNPTAATGGAANTFLDGLYAGGNATATPSYGAGGGAGNAGAGGNGSGVAGGTGGAGTANSATGVSVTYGTGGVGGFNAIAGASGAANTGTGGKGGTGTSNGGSGVVVVRVG